MITDDQIQAGAYITHIPSDGSHIADGAPDPDKFLVMQGLPTDPELMFIYIAGKPNAVGEVAIERPICQNTGTLQFAFDLALDARAAKSLQAAETDIKATIGGKTFNLSTQLNFAKGGILQTSDSSQGWIDTTLKPGLLTPFKAHHYDFLYKMDVAAGVCSYIDLYLDEKEYSFGAEQQNLPGEAFGWSDGALIQFQFPLNANGGEAGIVITNAKLIWS